MFVQVTHLGYYETEEEAAHVYDRVAISLNGSDAQTNFPVSEYSQLGQISSEFRGLGREDLQRALGVKPMDKSSQFRGVSRKKGKWEAKVSTPHVFILVVAFELHEVHINALYMGRGTPAILCALQACS